MSQPSPANAARGTLRIRRAAGARTLCLLALLGAAAAAFAQGPAGPGTGLREDEVAFLADHQEPWALTPLAATPCSGGFAGTYPCEKVDLLAFLPLAALGGGSGNDIWGWTDPLTGHEYALAGRSTGTAFVDITDPENPIYLGNLPTHTSSSTWRDIKVYANHAFIVSEATDHGLQVFDLTQLRSVVSPPVTFTETAHYGQFGRAHNLVINEESGFAYAVGSRQGTTQCAAGLHMIDLHVPAAPTFAGCFSTDGYTHDAQCVNYSGPDADYAGHEVCFASNEDTLTLVDVNNKAAPAQISRTTYSGVGYTHQGWLSEDQHYFLVDDELDEANFGHHTKTHIWDVSNLDAPQPIGFFLSPTAAIDHNQYVQGNYVFQANYRSGLRILSLDSIASGTLSQVGYFDIYPASDSASFNGAWSVFPYYPSGNVVVMGIEQGLFVLRPNLCSAPASPATLSATAAGANQVDLSWTAPGAPPATEYRVERAWGSCGTASFETLASGLAGTTYSDTAASGSIANAYRVVAVNPAGGCVSGPSACADATPTGSCTAPPAFAGVETVTNPGSATCTLSLSWSAASPRCGAGVSYNVYRGTASGFAPTAGNRIASGVSATSYDDATIGPGVTYYYLVRAVDATTGVEDTNTVERSAAATGPNGDGVWLAGAELGDPAFSVTTINARHAGWHPDDERVRTGERAYAAHVDPDLCSALYSPVVELSPGTLPLLTFWSSTELEAGDGGVIEISADGGTTWSLLPLLGGQPGSLPSAANACGFPAGTPAVVGNVEGWVQTTADLSPWAGQVVRLRFVLATDSAGAVTEGWFLDDLAITHARIPTVCTGAGIFSDGFETGDTSGWTVTVP